MLLSKSDIICGLAAKEARDLLRYIASADPPASLIARHFGLTDEDVAARLDHFEREDLIQLGEHERWGVTLKGSAVALARFGRPMKRKKAEELLAGAIERVRAYNSNQSYLLAIAEVTVFGSFVSDKPELGDLDLGLTVMRRDDRTYADDAYSYGRRNRPYLDYFRQICWAPTELVQIIKNRSPLISIVLQVVPELTDKYKIVYKIEDDDAAIQLGPHAGERYLG